LKISGGGWPVMRSPILRAPLGRRTAPERLDRRWIRRLLSMSGHSKWASIKHKKAIVDSRRGAHFSKLARAIMVAARDGGGDPDLNATLENAVRKAKEASMPKENIERAIAKGTGEGGEADAIETVLYEGYGPGGVAVLVEALTDNRNRTGADIRHAFSKHGGSLGEPGSVAYLFDKKGTIVIEAARYSEEELMVAVEAGAEDISTDEGVVEVITEPADFARVRNALEGAGVEMESAEMVYRPSSLVPIDEGQAGKLMRLIETLEESDDVEAVHANFDVSAEVLQRVAG
jgi:YebC/PmpR family DNA-binding regulatory protein